MPVLLGPFTRLASVTFPAHFDVLAIQASVERPAGDTFTGGFSAIAAIGISVNWNGNGISGTGAPAHAYKSGNGSLHAFNGGMNVGASPATPADPFTGAMRTNNYLFSPKNNSSAQVSPSSGASSNFPDQLRTFGFLNMTRLAELFGAPSGGIVVSVAMQASDMTNYQVHLEVFKDCRSLPISSLSTCNIQNNSQMGWSATRFYNATTTITPSTHSVTMSPIVSYLITGLPTRNYVINNNGVSGLTTGVTFAFAGSSG